MMKRTTTLTTTKTGKRMRIEMIDARHQNRHTDTSTDPLPCHPHPLPPVNAGLSMNKFTYHTPLPSSTSGLSIHVSVLPTSRNPNFSYSPTASGEASR